MINKLNVKRVAVSLAVVSGILYLACALLVFVAPDFAMSLFNNLFHGIDLTKIADTSFSISATLIGLVEIIAYALIAGALFAWTYNKIK